MNKVLILGASSDIGHELILKFLNSNYKIYAHYNLNKPKINSKNISFLKSDFMEVKEFEEFLLKIKNIEFSCFVNLIGFIDNKDIQKVNYSSLINSLKVNYVSPFMIAKTISKNMKKNKFGRLLQCSSIGVKFGGGENTFTYSSAKHAIEFIPRYFRQLSKYNVLYNVLRIGVTETKIHKKISKKNMKLRISKIPQKKIAKPIEIANFIYELTSEKNTFISNQVLSISGGE